MEESKVTIGISPGARHIGIAVLRGVELLDFRIALIRDGNYAQRIERLRRVMCRIMAFHKPDCVAIRKVHPARSSKFLDCIVLEMKKLFKDKSLEVREYSVEELRSVCGEAAFGNKVELAEHLATTYPILVRFLKNSRKPNFHQLRIFEAVAAAKVAYSQQ